MESRNMLVAVWAFVCFSQLTSLIEACNCLVNHPQTKFCYSDFVVQATVNERKQIVHPDTTRSTLYRYLIGYRVEIQAVYKGKDYLGDETETWIHTPDAGGLCGVSGLKTGQSYLLSGRYTRDMFYMTYCDLWKAWKSVTEEQRSGLTSTYSDNCDCRIRGVIGIIQVPDRDRSKVALLNESPLWNANSCRFNPVASLYYKSKDCETKYSSCLNINDTCSWERTALYLRCYEAREGVWRHYSSMNNLAATRRRLRCNSGNIPFLKRCMEAKKRRMNKRRLVQKLVASPTSLTAYLTGSGAPM